MEFMKIDPNKLLKSLIDLDKKAKELDEQMRSTRYEIHNLLWTIAKDRRAQLAK